jgi:tRNA 2-thiouridine synthesizing protein D
MTPKALVIFLATTPYGAENASTALRLAAAALAKGHRVTLFASGDGVYLAQIGQHPSGLPDTAADLSRLIEAGLEVQLCGTCLRFRGLGRELLVDGAAPSSLKNLFTAVAGADVFLSLTG